MVSNKNKIKSNAGDAFAINGINTVSGREFTKCAHFSAIIDFR